MDEEEIASLPIFFYVILFKIMKIPIFYSVKPFSDLLNSGG